MCWKFSNLNSKWCYKLYLESWRSLTTATTVVTPTVSTTYTVRGANGACSSTRTITIVVNAKPTLTVSATPTVICSGSTSTLTANGATTYIWNPGALTGTSVVVTPTVSGSYTVTGLNASGCTNTAVVSVSVNALPSLTVASTPTAICIGGTSTISVTGAITYTWVPGASTGTNIVVTPSVSTSYTVLGTNSNGCIGTKTINLSVTPVPTLVSPAVASVSLMCQAALTNVTLTASGATNYTWTPGALTGSNVSSFTDGLNYLYSNRKQWRL